MTFIRLKKQLRELFGREVDLVTENSVSPYLREKILKKLKVIYNADGYHCKFQTHFWCHSYIEIYTQNILEDEFKDNHLIQNGVIRQLTIIGEAVKYLSENIRSIGLKINHHNTKPSEFSEDFFVVMLFWNKYFHGS